MDANFDNSTTHLLCIRPSRNEKMLGSIASGKWILHCSYLRDSERVGKFLDVSTSLPVSLSFPFKILFIEIAYPYLVIKNKSAR